MTGEDIAIKLEGHDHEIGSLKHRMKEQEEQTKVIQDLVLSVKELALNMKNMMEEQKKAGERLTKLEQEPVEQWNSAKRAAFNTVIGAIAGAAATGMVALLAQYM